MLSKHSRVAGAMARLALPPAALLLLAAGQATAQNLLTNPDFDTSLAGWQVIGAASWDATLDADGSPASGSAKGVFDASTVTGLYGIVSQCVPLTIGDAYTVGGDVFISAGQTAPGSAFFIVIPFPTDGCSGPPPPAGPFIETPPVTAVGSWTSSIATFVNTYGNSAQVSAYLAPQAGGRLQANFDDLIVAPATRACVPDAHTLCLLGSRFKVTATFDTGTGTAGDAQALPVGNSGNLWFFDPGNVEALVKVIDGCALGGHFWFFGAGLTNLHVVITVIDTQTGAARSYENPANTAFQPIQDTAAFNCS
jgi:hypothetical protein